VRSFCSWTGLFKLLFDEMPVYSGDFGVLEVPVRKCYLLCEHCCVTPLPPSSPSHLFTIAELRPRITSRDILECDMCIVIKTKVPHFLLIRGPV
jgi:hypothetical protein